jgi:hypothetical protein
MSEFYLSYKEIPKYCDRVDRNRRSCVALSRFQASLYRRLVKAKVRPVCRLHRLADLAVYGTLLGIVLALARNLLLLAYFHDQDEASIDDIEFSPVGNRQILVTFNSSKEPFVFQSKQTEPTN